MSKKRGYSGGRNQSYNGSKRPYRDDYREFERQNKPHYDDREYGRYDYKNDDRRDRAQYERPANDDVMFSVKRFKKKAILIEDMNGRRFAIRGNFANSILQDMVELKTKMTNMDTTDENNVAVLLSMLKEWCLKLINMNVDNEVYTMEDVESGFDDIDALVAVFRFMCEQTAKSSKNSDVVTQHK